MRPDFSRDARIASILTRIAQLPKKPRLLITIDGPCGSGKSTLADALSAALNAPIIRMDDFFLPHALKTPQRLAIPGGNVDLERLMQEVIIPFAAGQPVVYRRYLCREDAFSAPIPLPMLFEALVYKDCRPAARAGISAARAVGINVNVFQFRHFHSAPYFFFRTF